MYFNIANKKFENQLSNKNVMPQILNLYLAVSIVLNKLNLSSSTICCKLNTL